MTVWKACSTRADPVGAAAVADPALWQPPASPRFPHDNLLALALLASMLLHVVLYRWTLSPGIGGGLPADGAASAVLQVRLAPPVKVTAPRATTGAGRAPRVEMLLTRPGAASANLGSFPSVPFALSASSADAPAPETGRDTTMLNLEAQPRAFGMDTYYPPAMLDVQAAALAEVPLPRSDEASPGSVRIVARVYIDETGRVVFFEVVSAEPAGLLEVPVAEAFAATPFSPGERAGQPVKSYKLVEVLSGS
ncbi:energy transducer TonB [Gulbenkiania indica]|uniref:energy transducer TonB n=1 Tax=Gulbenkiania indica TaxID=375574 RepID=UPI0006E2D2FD|nr:hypothetical protein [Gulbenkiania indica]